MHKRTLKLEVEHLTELTSEDLAAAAGGAIQGPTYTCTGIYPTLPVNDCVAKSPTNSCLTGIYTN